MKKEELIKASQLFLNLKQTAKICQTYREFILDVVERAKKHTANDKNNNSRLKFICSLSIAITICPQLKSYAVSYLKSTGNFLPSQEQRKSGKVTQNEKQLVVEQTEAVWRFVRFLGHQVQDVVCVDHLLAILGHHRDMDWVVWLCADSVANLLSMSSSQRDKLLESFFPDEKQFSKIKIRHYEWCQLMAAENISTNSIADEPSSVDCCDLVESVVMVAGILLPKLVVQQSVESTMDLIPVESMMSNLHSLALAVSSGSPVLLQGPVGSGKTSLVEHLARITGRHKSPYLMKVQLGDQTDSKALLGTYRCTDIPGEFTWQAGVLTRAVREGHWVLLEDIDYAPMDVISVLLPLLERNTLSVPGHGDNLTAAPGFQLFATQRLLGSGSGWHRQQSGSSVLLEKMWTKINVKPLTRNELQQVIQVRFPQLSTVIDKLLDVYFMLSASKHDIVDQDVSTAQQEVDSQTVGKFLSHDGRLISTRDFMNWCSRIAQDFDVSSSSTANLVLQEALDCFVSCIPKVSRRILVAEAIGAKLNVNKIMAEYFCIKYKPDLKMTPTTLTSGRVQLDRKARDTSHFTRRMQSTFSFTRQSSAMLEKVAVCIARNEPVLLVGETGTGKTSCVQYLSEQLGNTLKVINMNQQSDSSDLLGGFKPVDMKHVVRPFREDFDVLFCDTFSRSENIKFLGHLQECFARGQWSTMLTLMDHTITPALKRFKSGKMSKEKYDAWMSIRCRLQQLKVQMKNAENTLAFAFIEGTLVKAVRNGDWVLLDEINLAAAETLECLSGLLESTGGSVVLTERGDVEPVIRHPDFRLFACMNPATDVGKKDLPIGIRNRFTEFYVDELEENQDLKILVSDYLKGLSLTPQHVDGIVKFYKVAREEASKHLTDGTGHKPHYSLRTLCRALKFAGGNPCGQTARSLYEGFCLSFLTQLDRVSHPLVETKVCQHIVGKANVKAMLKAPLPMPSEGKYLNIEGYWISMGTDTPQTQEKYILTQSVRENLKDLSRVVSAGQHPVLIQGETSVGKTSLVTWLAQVTGNMCVRVNNHEHTDLQEYVGSYSADQHGKLIFKEGVLVEAMRKGYWVILDELNLAPSDVLEALNRLLDDNRELFIPETQEMVKAHTKFMLFATQNPPGHYGGRKLLSRAFRNRFVELHFDQIPSGELETILHQRCDLPMSYSRRLVATMLDLQTRRRGSGVFAGKQGFMTLRDLFRWAQRYKCKTASTAKFYDWDQHMADHGYMLLSGRVRKPEEVVLVQEVIQKHLKRSVDPDKLFTLNDKTSMTTLTLLQEVTQQTVTEFGHIVWTYSMRRLAVLIGQAIQFNEPVLLVGDTGCGKTTICQLYAALNRTGLNCVNCHLHTESADFLGGLRPCRSHENMDDGKEQKLFEWVDGPLVNSMRGGSMFLIDEISLADDSVLERLNSVLEPERTLLLAEKGGGDKNQVDIITAKEGFQVFATMNPGGDFGKKELSPALRNRFTEIWCPQSNNCQDLTDIIEHNLRPGIHLCNQEDATSGIGHAVMDFIHWFSNNDIGKRCTVSIRDILSWVHFINTCSKTVDDETMEIGIYNKLDPAVAFIHGACLVFLDGLGSGTTSRGRDSEVEAVRNSSLKYLLQLVSHMTHHDYNMASLGLIDKMSDNLQASVSSTSDKFCVSPFEIKRGNEILKEGDKYTLQAPTTCVNAQRILRALQLTRPLLLEGSPGVGKTSLVSAIAKAAGQKLVRINLSEQTDVTDLFGADLPVEGQEGGVFAWRDGPFLQALKAGHWIVLDELNLASQSVLEGLNACLDHRSEVYVPELGKTFHIRQDETRLFACQNPLNQGGGRKGLPRSFLNRFTQVYVEPLSFADLLFIATTMYPIIPEELLKNMVKFNMQIHQETVIEGKWGQKGSPWEFNLRDLFRWCDLLLQNQSLSNLNPGEYVGLLYQDRMRTLQDKAQVHQLYKGIFLEELPFYVPSRYVKITSSVVQAGHSFLPCQTGEFSVTETTTPNFLLHHSLSPMEAVIKCVEMKWMSILVGPQSSGKTSLIQLLSQLSGHPLRVLAMNSSMDTTELLGGFEQADIGNQVDKMATDLSVMVTDLTILILENKHLHQVVTLQRGYNDHRVNTGNSEDKLTSVEELQLLRNRVSKMKAVIMIMKDILQNLLNEDFEVQKAKIETLESELNRTQTYLQAASPGSGGGAFHWVDSVLVHALQEGHWLLIDNVNFCSASVLDRLNALLEPNGVLSINERGVIDGCIPTIKPHPDFRLFLAMDPKFGEISRAMRNRGVEIYIPGEDDGCPYSKEDVMVMLKGQGLFSTPACDWLYTLHLAMRTSMSRGERPIILDLLHAALVTKQQIERGTSLIRALLHASSVVYVKSIKHVAAKKIAEDLWEEHIKSLVSLHSSGEDVTVVSTQDFLHNRDITNIRLNAATIISNLNRIVAMETSDLETSLMKLWHAGTLFLDMSSGVNWQLHYDWLASYLTSMWMKVEAKLLPDQSKAVRCCLDMICTGMQNTMENNRHLGTVSDLKQFVHLLTKDHKEGCLMIEDNPQDLRWNAQCLYRVLERCDPMCTANVTLHHMFNRLHILHMVTKQIVMEEQNVSRLRTYVEGSGGRLHTHIELLELHHLFAMVTELLAGIHSLKIQNYEDVAKILDAMLWRSRLLEACQSSVWSNDLDFNSVSLYWNWFYNKGWSAISESMPPSVHSVVNQLHSRLGENNAMVRIFLMFWRTIESPAPYKYQEEAELTLTLIDIARSTDLEVESVDMVTEEKVQLLIKDGGIVRDELLNAFALVENLTDENKESINSKIQAIKDLLKKYELGKRFGQESAGSVNIPTTGVETLVQSSSWQHVQLWPLFGFSSLLYELSLMSNVIRSGDCVTRVKSLTEFCVQFTPSSPLQISLYKKLQNGHQSKDEGSVLTVYNELFKKLCSSPAVHSTNRWLLWNGHLGEETQNTDSQGSYTLHMASISHMMFSLLCGSQQLSQNSKITKSLQPLQVSLSEIDIQKEKLGLLSSHLWSQGTTLSHQDNTPSTLERRNMLEMFVYFLRTSTTLIAEDQRTEFTTSVDQISQLIQTPENCVLRSHIESCGDILATNLPHCQQLVNKSMDLIGQAIASCDLIKTGHAWVYLGLLYRTLLTPMVTFDPVEKISVKLKHFMEELKNIQCELQVYNEHQCLLTGQELTSVSHDLLHPRIPYLVARVTFLQQQIQMLEEQQAFRPNQSQFKYLLSDIKNYLSSVGSDTHIMSLLDKLSQSMVSMTTSNVVSEEKMWQKTHMSFLNKLETDYPLYKDLVIPFTVAVRQVMHGIRLVAGSAQQHISKQKLIGQINDACKNEVEADIIDNRLMKLSSFPMLSMDCVSYLDLVKTLTSELTTGMIQSIVRRSEEDTSVIEEKSLLSSLLHACLDYVRNDSLIRRELTSELTFVLSSLFQQFVMAWQAQEEERRRKEEEEGSMYRYKSKTHGDDRDNDVIEEEEFKESFPTFDKHFVDIMGVDNLEDSTAMEVDGDEEISKEEETTHDRISEAEMDHVYHCHNDIFTHLTKAKWLPQSPVPQVKSTDTVKPVLSTYLITGTLSSRCHDVLSCDFDAFVVGGHLLVSNSTQEEITQSQIEAGSSLYDIYHDSNVSEIVQCRPVIKTLMTRVNELHEEWPDHPTLKQLIQISDRIQSFPVTSPVMKFLTGMELLLEKAQEWESNAAKHVSLATELTNVSALIIKWRKLELSCWSQCLDSVWRKHKQKSCKWWFYLFQLIQAYLTKQQEEESNQQQEVMKALKQFIENSTLGDFHVRLAMIRAFQCQLVYVEESERKENLLYYLHNLYEFYCQFSELVSDELTRLRSPIQKELKGFVKISRWTDMNYWALKQTTEKTHRTLHKHMKAFQVVLEQSIKGILTESKSESDPSMWLTEFQDTIKSTNFAVNSSLVVTDVQTTDADALQSRLPTLCKRVSRHLSKYTGTVKYNSLIQTVEEFTGEIIETVHELQALEINQTAEKDKQLSEAKHFNLKKRKALSDLFRYLTLFGLSYRKGLIMLTSEADADSSLLVPALDISAMFQDVTSVSPVTAMVSLWRGCKQYYYRCIGRRGQFLSALLSAHKELGLGNIERCKGFTEHLMQYLVQSHTQIAASSSHYRSLCNIIQQLSKLSQDEKETVLPVNEVKEKIESLKGLAVTVIEGLAQFEVLLQSCPLPSGGVTPYPSPYPREELPQIATVKKGDELWTNTVSVIQSLQVKAKEIHSALFNMSGSNSIWTWEDLNKVTETVHELQTLVPDLLSVEKLFYLPGTDSICAFNNTLNFIRTHICEKIVEFEKWESSLKEERSETDIESLSDIATNVESLIEKLLLVIQTLVKSHTDESISKNSADQEAMENEEDGDIEQGHYTKLLFDKLQQDSINIANNKVLMMVEDLFSLLSQSQCVNQSCIQRVVCILPLLRQYTNLVGHNLLQLLAFHRSTGKLLSTLLGVFIELASKGFCTPAEFSDEVGGEGATDFEDIEGGGMGEGEGAKNVSDQIENEDQLDEAQKPGQKEEEESNQPDVPSEENAIEMSEDFDGKMQDLEDADKQDNEEEDEGDEENELDKQMGDVDENEADKLDEQMWGSEDEGEEEQKEESKEEKGSGDGQEDESRLVANDDNKEAGEDQNKDSKDKEENADDNEDVKPHQQEIDESEYDEDKVDPYHNKKEEEQPQEAMDLPDDLNLDDDEQGDSEDKQDGQGEEETMEEEAKMEEPEEVGETTPEETPGTGEENKADEKEEEKEENEDDSNENKDTNEEQTDDKGNKEEEDVDVKEEEGEDKPGFTAQDDAEEDETSKEEENKKAEDDQPELAEHHGKTSHGVQDVEQSDTAQDQAGQTEDNQEKNEGTGSSTSEQLEGHQGQSSSQVMQGTSADKEKKPLKRKPGKSDADRSLGSAEQKYKKLKTVDQSPAEEQNDGSSEQEKMESDLYEHIKDSTSQADAQTLDTATDEQQRQQTINKEDQGSEVSDDDVAMQEEDGNKDENEVEEKLSAKLKNKNQKYSEDGKEGEQDDAMETEEAVKHEIPGEVIATATVGRGPESTIHTALENLHFDSSPGELDIEKLRSELEDQLDTWSHTHSPEAESIATEAWHRYEALTSSLSQDLCEQLRLVLEPSQATKLKGDYRTGKRLNMRKVIPYIASQFRKDKIWLRRTKPSKRQYQIMLAIDDSSSMVDNHSKQLAYESLALITNALTLLESGELGICSFGEKVQVLHPLTEQFTTQSGARLLQQFTFEQKKTKIAQLLKHMTSLMVDARSRQHGMLGNPETSQLLLIVSDGRGLFMEGMETVKTAVRQAREANIFLVFVIIDNPQCRDSILDIKVPVFKDGGMKPEIKSYMDHFPFPFYIILRDINSLPHVLCDALRQWFELVTAMDS